MKWGRTARLTTQGAALIAIVGYMLLLVKQHYVEGSHLMSHGFFNVVAAGALGGTVGFSCRRILKEIQRVQRNAGRR